MGRFVIRVFAAAFAAGFLTLAGSAGAAPVPKGGGETTLRPT